jgi:hypothetical protein
VLTTLAVTAAVALTPVPAAQTVVTIAAVSGQGSETLTVSGTFSCASKAVHRLVVTVNDPNGSLTFAARIMEDIACPATDQPYRVNLTRRVPGTTWRRDRLDLHADLRDDDTVRAATYAPIDGGTLLAIGANTATLLGGNLVVTGKPIGAERMTITVEAAQDAVHGSTTATVDGAYQIPVHPTNAKVFQNSEPIDFLITAHLERHPVTPTISGTLTPTRPTAPPPRMP